jgi:hypothetical protein
MPSGAELSCGLEVEAADVGSDHGKTEQIVLIETVN